MTNTVELSNELPVTSQNIFEGIVIGGISKGLVASKKDLSGKEFAAAVMLETAVSNILSRPIAARCEDCESTGKCGSECCFSCSGTGKLLDGGVNYDLYELELSMYAIDDVFGDYLVAGIKNAVRATGIVI